jgi:hypothetical protein
MESLFIMNEKINVNVKENFRKASQIFSRIISPIYITEMGADLLQKGVYAPDLASITGGLTCMVVAYRLWNKKAGPKLG